MIRVECSRSKWSFEQCGNNFFSLGRKCIFYMILSGESAMGFQLTKRFVKKMIQGYCNSKNGG